MIELVVARGNPLRYGYLALGFLFLASAVVGVIVPGWPVTINCILALWAFKRSSPRMEAWLLNHPVVGPILREWELNKSVARSTKRVAIVTLWVFISVSIAYFALRPLRSGHEAMLIIMLATTAGLVTWYIASRKTTPEAP